MIAYTEHEQRERWSHRVNSPCTMGDEAQFLKAYYNIIGAAPPPPPRWHRISDGFYLWVRKQATIAVMITDTGEVVGYADNWHTDAQGQVRNDIHLDNDALDAYLETQSLELLGLQGWSRIFDWLRQFRLGW